MQVRPRFWGKRRLCGIRKGTEGPTKLPMGTVAKHRLSLLLRLPGQLFPVRLFFQGAVYFILVYLAWLLHASSARKLRLCLLGLGV